MECKMRVLRWVAGFPWMRIEIGAPAEVPTEVGAPWGMPTEVGGP